MNKYTYLPQQLQLLDDLRVEFYVRTNKHTETQMVGRHLITIFEILDALELRVTLDIDLDDPDMSVFLVKVFHAEQSVILRSEENLNTAWAILENIKSYCHVVDDNDDDTDAVITAPIQ